MAFAFGAILMLTGCGEYAALADTAATTGAREANGGDGAAPRTAAAQPDLHRGYDGVD